MYFVVGLASIPIKEQLLYGMRMDIVGLFIASIPIKEQLLCLGEVDYMKFDKSFNSYKGTIVMMLEVMLLVQLKLLQFL